MCPVRPALADIGDGELVLPASTEAVELVDVGAVRPQHVALLRLGGVVVGLCAPVLTHVRPVALPADGDLPKVAVGPAHGGLHDVELVSMPTVIFPEVPK